MSFSSDHIEVFNLLNNSLGNTAAKLHFASTLKHFLLVPTHIVRR